MKFRIIAVDEILLAGQVYVLVNNSALIRDAVTGAPVTYRSLNRSFRP